MTDSLLKILYVDDLLVNCKLMQKIVKKIGFGDIDTCESAEEALVLQEKNLYDIIISDFNLGGMNGLELINVLKTKDYDTNVLIVTEHAKVKNAIAVIKAGAYDYLEAPIHPDILKCKIEEISKILKIEDQFADTETGLKEIANDALANMSYLQVKIIEYESKLKSIRQLISNKKDNEQIILNKISEELNKSS
jgi:DNA-binding NtrC family response regulator